MRFCSSVTTRTVFGFKTHGASDWANRGFARMTYGDWQTNGMDAWIGQVGRAHQPTTRKTSSSGLNFKRVGGKAETMAGDQSLLLSSNDNLSAQQINPYIIDLENNGTLSDGGQFATEPEDLHDLLSFYLPKAIRQWRLADNQPIDIAIYAHGGLVPEESAAKTARIWVPALFARKIFPVFLMWETGWGDILKAIAKDAFDRVRGVAGAAFWDKATDWWNERLENLVSGLGTLEWDEMKENAEAASKNSKGGLQMLYQELLKPEHAALQIEAAFSSYRPQCGRDLARASRRSARPGGSRGGRRLPSRAGLPRRPIRVEIAAALSQREDQGLYAVSPQG